jgi:RNA polymerase sigma-54 factor
MGLEAKLVQKMGQSLLMTPQLQQAIKLLQLGRLEYKEAIERELLENPVLEEMRDESEYANLPSPEPEPSGPAVLSSIADNSDAPEIANSAAGTEPSADWDSYEDSFTDYQGSASAKSTIDYEDRQPPEVVATLSESLEQHLLQQVRMHDFSHTELVIVQHLIGNLDRDGYLECTHEEIAETCSCDLEDVQIVADTLRFFDPPGVCARNLQECLLTQLEAKGCGDRLEARILTSHLEKLEKRRFDAIAKAEGVTLEQVGHAINAIRSLEPRPGRPFADETTRYIIPDVYVQKIGREWVVTLNDEGIPRLRVNPQYTSLLKEKGHEAHTAASHSYVAERMRAATWLIKSIQQRQQTILRVTEAIMKVQREFLEHGIDKLKPLVLKEIADQIDMHESTVSRVTTEKYVHTPRGVFELKFFFTSGIKTGSGADISSSSVKERIKSIIAAESPKNPISDQHIAEMLKAEKIDIARRTVAKYREMLGIPSSSQRKALL